ncbi:MAG: hypothetical protein DRH10_07385 [Deltaproteobacteria bacterium]|nr:MAG: hypothetical protein DRH10_07385 [Deltaproteobacteria bacterium]
MALAGCRQGQLSTQDLLSVDFSERTLLRYKLVSSRDIEINFDSAGSAGKSRPQKMSEKLELVIAYKPVELDPYGLSTIEGRCESAKVSRTSVVRKPSGRDAAESLAGQTFTFQITPTGRIKDYTNLKALVRRCGDKAFASSTGRQGRIKNPDMITDFSAFQWHFWDSIASIEDAVAGVEPGQSWKATQFIALPMPIPAARETTYTLDRVEETDSGKKAVITSTYKLSDSRVKNWPRPYKGQFNMRGMFGFLRNFKFRSLEGAGEQIFNIDTGTIENEQQHYKVHIDAGFMMPLGDTVPTVTIDQKISVQLLGD